MKWWIFLVLAACASVLHASVPLDSIDDFITAEMPVSGAPGLAFAVLDGGEIYSGRRGEIVRGSGREITPETPFVIGSISKSFTALAVVQLAEAGKLDLESEISQYLEVFSGRPGESITIRQLLSHTSGYSTLQGNDNLFGTEPGDQAAGELSRQVERIAQWTPDEHPGTKWDYSNANYYILGALIEALSGQDYASYIKAEILGPIGMTHSFVADGGRYDMIARGHTPWFGMKRPVKGAPTHRMSAPVGGIIATASDVARYLDVMMNGKDDIISAKSKAEMMSPASGASPFYGFGWSVNPNDGTVSHTGLTPGIETLAIMIPSAQKGAVIFVNSGSGMGFGESADLFNGLSAKALGLDFIPSSDGGRWSRRAMFLMFALLPLLFVIGIIQAWARRRALRSKSGLFGMFSLWFPLVMMVVFAWTCIYLIPKLFGVSIGTLQLFSPDLAVSLMASAITGLIWAIFRLGVVFGGKLTAK